MTMHSVLCGVTRLGASLTELVVMARLGCLVSPMLITISPPHLPGYYTSAMVTWHHITNGSGHTACSLITGH